MAKRKGGDSTASTSTKKGSNKKDGTASAKTTASTSTKKSNNIGATIELTAYLL